MLWKQKVMFQLLILTGLDKFLSGFGKVVKSADND